MFKFAISGLNCIYTYRKSNVSFQAKHPDLVEMFQFRYWLVCKNGTHKIHKWESENQSILNLKLSAFMKILYAIRLLLL